MMFPTASDLPEQTRQAMIGLLQAQVSDGQDLFYQLRQAHWTVRGPGFIGLHTLFEEIYKEVDAHVDELAERLQTLGGHTEGTIDVAAKNSRLPKYPVDAVTPAEHIDALATALGTFANNVRKAIEEADEAGDEVTADLLTAITGSVDGRRWMIEAHKPVK